MNPWVVHFYFPIFGTLFIPIDTPIPDNCVGSENRSGGVRRRRKRG